MLVDAPKLVAVLQFARRDGGGTKFVEGFVRKFNTLEDVARTAPSISILQRFSGGQPHTYLPEMCVAPRNRDVEAPKTRAFDELLPLRFEVLKSDLYVFKNHASGRELQLYATTALAVPETQLYREDLFKITLTTGYMS